MTGILAINNATSGAPAAVGLAAAAGNTLGAPRTMPAFIRADEAYYWSFQWQDDVRESMAALAAGDYEDFDSDDPNDVARWMLSVGDDED